MFMRSREIFVNTRLAQRVVIAAIVGSTVGAAAGLWSVRRGSTTAPLVPTPSSAAMAGSSSTASGQRAASGSLARHDDTAVASPVQAIPSAARPSPSAGIDSKDVLVRARALAQHADVKALVALREGVVRLAAERGETGSPASKQQLDELDRYLEQARMLRLKLDAEEFRRADAVGGRPDKRP